jgi:hypothetical protein
MTVENDCEDQGMTTVADGCASCRTSEVVKNSDGQDVLKPMPLSQRAGYWICTNCGGSYGPVT